MYQKQKSPSVDGYAKSRMQINKVLDVSGTLGYLNGPEIQPAAVWCLQC